MDVLSHVPGRVRLRDERIYKKEKLSCFLDFYLMNIVGIKKSRVNSTIGTIVISYDKQKISIEALKNKVDKIIDADYTYTKYLKEYYKEFINEYENYKSAKKRMIFFGGLYVLFKLKELYFGKFFINRSLPVLKIAAFITITKGYPVIKKVLKRIEEYFPTDLDKSLLVVGSSFTLMREGNKGTMLLFLKSFSDALQSYSMLRIKKIMLMSNPNPNRLIWYRSKGKEYLTPLENIENGDIVSIYKGEVILIDGVVNEGRALINNVYYSGQPEIKYLKKGDKVFEGMVVTKGKINIKVNRVPRLKAKQDLLIENLKLGNTVNKYREKAIYYALVMAGVSYLITGNSLSILSVLLLMSPSATNVALNIGLANYIKLLLDHNIIIRNVNTIEKIINSNSMVFDKTGTLTKKRLRIGNIEMYDKRYSIKKLLKVCSTIESNVAHPVAYTLSSLADANKQQDNIDTVYIPSKGITSSYEGRRITIGNKDLLKQQGVNIQKINNRKEKFKYYLPVYFAVNRRLIARIDLIEELEEEIIPMVKKIKENHFKKISIISGDLQKNVNDIGQKINIDECYGELSLEDKRKYIENEKKSGTVIMVGDGINDVGAMQSADVSISYADNAAYQAVLQSDCIISEGGMVLLPKVLDLTKKSYYRIQKNIDFAQSYNFIFGTLGMLGYIDPFKAKSLNTLNSIIAIFNSSRINRITYKERGVLK